VETLKEELQITEQDFDIHFIDGNFADYFTEGKVLGQGASGVVKKYTRVQNGEVYAVKSVRYRGDTERLLLVALFLPRRKFYLYHFFRLLKSLKITESWIIKILLKSMNFTLIISTKESILSWNLLSARNC